MQSAGGRRDGFEVNQLSIMKKCLWGSVGRKKRGTRCRQRETPWFVALTTKLAQNKLKFWREQLKHDVRLARPHPNYQEDRVQQSPNGSCARFALR